MAEITERLGTLRDRYAGSPSLDNIKAALQDVDGKYATSQQLQDLTTKLEQMQATGSSSNMLRAMEAELEKRDALKQTLGHKVLAGAGAVAGAAAAAATLQAVGIPGWMAGTLGSTIGGAVAAGALGKMRGRLANLAQSAASRTASVAESFAKAGEKVKRAAPMGVTAAMSAARYAPQEEVDKEPSRPKVATKNPRLEAFRARERELHAISTVGPDGRIVLRKEVKEDIHEKVRALWAISPALGDKVEGAIVRRLEYVAQQLPRRPAVGGIPIGPDRWAPSEMDLARFSKVVWATERPVDAFGTLIAGNTTPEIAEALRRVYPEMTAQLVDDIDRLLPRLRENLPYEKRLALSILSGRPVDPAMEPRILQQLQSQYVEEPGTEGGTQAPKPVQSMGSIGKPEPTRAQSLG